MRLIAPFCVFVSIGLASVVPAAGFERMSGCFVGERVCEAKSSIRRNRNPGSVKIETGKSYRLLGANKAAATHYQIVVPGIVNPGSRWVDVSCGRVVASCGASTNDGQAAARRKPGTKYANNVLAISWQPSFCQLKQSKPECQSQTAARFDASHFSLHGLWPQPRSNIYCGVAQVDKQNSRKRRWGQIAALTLSAPLRQSLDKVMPGTQSHLQRHEWIKHGVCYSDKPQDYYADSINLMNQINTSAVQKLFKDNIGKVLTSGAVRAAFDRAFGPGSGKRVTVSCSGSGTGRMISELVVAVQGEIGPAVNLKALMLAAKERRAGCPSGLVDAAGF